MTWVAWRQHRLAIGVWLVASLGVAVVMAWSMKQVVDLQPLVLRCSAATSYAAAHGFLCFDTFGREKRALQVADKVIIVMAVLPLVPGVALGATLLPAEFERGTHLLVWTQGVTRRRWLLTKLAVVAIPVALGSAGAALASTWIAHESVRLYGPFSPYQRWIYFDYGWVAPVGYALFATCLGVLVGAMIRSTLASMILAALGFIAVRLITVQLRPGFVPPLRVDPAAVQSLLNSGTAWVVRAPSFCLGAGCPPAGSFYYHPASRFALFQGIEFAIFAAAAAACILAATWLLSRRA